MNFLNAVFEDSGQPLVSDVEILNPFLDKDALFDKTSVLDVKARTESGTLIDVEIQLWDRYHTTFHLREDVTGVLLTDLLEIHFVELRKLREQSVGLERRLVRWMLFLTAKSRESLEGLAMQDPAIKKALTTLEFLSQDEEARRLYEERMKGLQTYMAEIHGAKEEGRKEGREEGREEGRKEGDRNARKEVAKKLLQMGLTIEQVVESTSLSREEIEVIQEDLLQ